MKINLNNPWKGLDFYTQNDSSSFFGRSKETAEIVDLVYNEPCLVLYGPSGIGKSSILNAGVFPALNSEEFFVVYIRAFDFDSKETYSKQIIQQIQEAADRNGIEIVSLEQPTDVDSNFQTESSTLWLYLHTHEFWSRKNNLLMPLIVLDQFEEIFTKSIDEDSVRNLFLEFDSLSGSLPPKCVRDFADKNSQFTYISENRLKFIISIREDFIPRLDDYVYSIGITHLTQL